MGQFLRKIQISLSPEFLRTKTQQKAQKKHIVRFKSYLEGKKKILKKKNMNFLKKNSVFFAYFWSLKLTDFFGFSAQTTMFLGPVKRQKTAF
jgi:hypothetical protein